MRFFPTLLGSFYSGETYRNVRASQGHGLAYSFLLTILTTLIPIVYFTFLFHRAIFTPYAGPQPIFDDTIMQIARQLPVMTLHDNQLMTRDAKPQTIYLDVSADGTSYKGAFATIDTTGATTYDNMKTPILVTAKEVIMRGKKETKIRTFEELTDGRKPTMVINQAMAQEMGTQLITFVHDNLLKFYFVLGLISWIGCIIVFYILRLCLLVVLALGGLLLGNFLRTKVSFDTAMRMAAVSYTPVALIQLLLLVTTAKSASVMWLVVSGLIMLGTALAITRESTLAEPA